MEYGTQNTHTDWIACNVVLTLYLAESTVMLEFVPVAEVFVVSMELNSASSVMDMCKDDSGKW